jgi:hypothetical protein
MESVSILTITQYSRKKLFNNLIEMVNNQNYSNIIEWVIVEGSTTKEEAVINKKNIFDNIIKSKIPIKYVEYENNTFAEKFNSGNSATCGKIIVVMEDDDFYPSTRVSHAVDKLSNQDKNENQILLAGCSPIIIFNVYTHEFSQFVLFSNYHSCNNSFAYYREYLINNKFSGNNYTIESSFTKNFSNEMIQLDPHLTIIHMFHFNNTINKFQFIEEWYNREILHKITQFNVDIKEQNIFETLINILKS